MPLSVDADDLGRHLGDHDDPHVPVTGDGRKASSSRGASEIFCWQPFLQKAARMPSTGAGIWQVHVRTSLRPSSGAHGGRFPSFEANLTFPQIKSSIFYQTLYPHCEVSLGRGRAVAWGRYRRL
jgi:hypothetical protein